ncbi:MAG: transposase [Cyanosarcina radialis HA8281-LM2]|jgi:putative transposase|nr:transposase [Cyanosarcina radialis HA8281-LM2]
MATRRVTFRLYPNKNQEEKLHYWRRLHKDLFNACLSQRKVEYERFGKSISYYDQQNTLPAFKECWYEYKELGSHALQATVKRVDFAYKRFFQKLGGKPRFKSARDYRGWTYPCKAGWKATTNGENGYLVLSNLGKIQMRGKARTWGMPTTCTIVWKQGKWYASITVDCQPVRETDTNSVGLDFGTYHAVACSDGAIIDNPRFLASTQDKVRKVSRKLSKKRAPNFKKKIKASKRWRKARKQVSQLQQKVARQRENWQHRVAAQIVSRNSMVATEKLNLKGMTAKAKNGKRKAQKTGLNRCLLDVGIGNILSLIKYKLDECQGVFVEVPTKQVAPSQTCPNCGHKQKKDLSERVHRCDCGCVLDRDVAAAQVMLKWALGTNVLNLGEESSTQIPTNCGGFRQLTSVRRQKPLPQPQAGSV